MILATSFGGKIEYLDQDDNFGSRKIISVIDGVEYTCYFKDEKKSHEFVFNNAESYLQVYPNVDELISYSELLSVNRQYFKIWKK